jgi:hypothetical protein
MREVISLNGTSHTTRSRLLSKTTPALDVTPD